MMAGRRPAGWAGVRAGAWLGGPRVVVVLSRDGALVVTAVVVGSDEGVEMGDEGVEVGEEGVEVEDEGVEVGEEFVSLDVTTIPTKPPPGMRGGARDEVVQSSSR